MPIHSSFARWSFVLTVLFALGTLLILRADEDVSEADMAGAPSAPSHQKSVGVDLSAPNEMRGEGVDVAAARERADRTPSEPRDRREEEEATEDEGGAVAVRDIESFVAALESRDDRAFDEAVESLSVRDPERLVSVLGLQLVEGPRTDDSDDAEFRSRAATGIAVGGGAGGVDFLISAFYGTDPRVQEAAANGLAQAGDDRATDTLLDAAEGSDPDSKSAAIAALSSAADESTRWALVKAYEQGRISSTGLPDDALEEILTFVPEDVDCSSLDSASPWCSAP